MTVGGVVRHQKVDDDRRNNGRKSFENLEELAAITSCARRTYKEPPPAGESRNAVHVVSDNTSEESRDGACNRHRGIEEGIASCKLVLAVPRGEKESTARGKAGLRLLETSPC